MTSAFGGQRSAAIAWTTSMIGQGDRFAALPTPEQAKLSATPAEQGPAERRSMRRSGNVTVDKQTKIKRSVAFNLGHKEQGEGESIRCLWRKFRRWCWQIVR